MPSFCVLLLPPFSQDSFLYFLPETDIMREDVQWIWNSVQNLQFSGPPINQHGKIKVVCPAGGGSMLEWEEYSFRGRKTLVQPSRYRWTKWGQVESRLMIVDGALRMRTVSGSGLHQSFSALTLDTLSWIILCCGDFPEQCGCLEASLDSTHQLPLLPPLLSQVWDLNCLPGYKVTPQWELLVYSFTFGPCTPLGVRIPSVLLRIQSYRRKNTSGLFKGPENLRQLY